MIFFHNHQRPMDWASDLRMASPASGKDSAVYYQGGEALGNMMENDGNWWKMIYQCWLFPHPWAVTHDPSLSPHLELFEGHFWYLGDPSPWVTHHPQMDRLKARPAVFQRFWPSSGHAQRCGKKPDFYAPKNLKQCWYAKNRPVRCVSDTPDFLFGGMWNHQLCGWLIWPIATWIMASSDHRCLWKICHEIFHHVPHHFDSPEKIFEKQHINPSFCYWWAMVLGKSPMVFPNHPQSPHPFFDGLGHRFGFCSGFRSQGSGFRHCFRCCLRCSFWSRFRLGFGRCGCGLLRCLSGPSGHWKVCENWPSIDDVPEKHGEFP